MTHLAAPGGLLATFVLERDLEFCAVGEGTIFAQLDVLGDDFRDSKVAKRAARCFDGHGRGVLPGLGACADEFGHAVNAHVPLLALRRLTGVQAVIPEWAWTDKAEGHPPARPGNGQPP
jgi:hypothetical protein